MYTEVARAAEGARTGSACVQIPVRERAAAVEAV